MWNCYTSDRPGPVGFAPPLRFTKKYSEQLDLVVKEFGNPADLQPGQSINWPVVPYPVVDYAVAYCQHLGIEIRFRKPFMERHFVLLCVSRWS